ncbi:nuclear transport factor 2 family protein [Tardiphaga sp. 862_B3_N4_1]|uniref:nuclear transport factor 2 family protein n=1 Tax=Tardiphaga sp. 862_B3_N4_1 TaxID=3240764 RepID=UPI003F1E5157
MSFDPMAAVVDWLDAYRSGDLESILGLYSDIATIECGCGGAATINGREALRAYWEQRLRDAPAVELENLQPARDGIAITYVCQDSNVRADFEFDTTGQIIFQKCGPAN